MFQADWNNDLVALLHCVVVWELAHVIVVWELDHGIVVWELAHVSCLTILCVCFCIFGC